MPFLRPCLQPFLQRWLGDLTKDRLGRGDGAPVSTPGPVGSPAGRTRRETPTMVSGACRFSNYVCTYVHFLHVTKTQIAANNLYYI